MTMSKSMQATGPNDKPVLVIKLGGSMLGNLSDDFFGSFSELAKDYRCVVVHGGGPAITNMMERLGVSGEFHQGLRRTNEEALEVVQMTLGGKVNADLTGQLTMAGVKALGVRGSDASLLTADYLDKEKLGFVGEVEAVDTSMLWSLIKQGYVPVVAPLGRVEDGQMVNINADVAAGEIAKALKADRLLFVTDVPGILRDGQLLHSTTPEEIDALIEQDVIYGGMIPKVKSAIDALTDDMQEVMIVSGTHRLIKDGIMVGTVIKHVQEVRVK